MPGIEPGAISHVNRIVLIRAPSAQLSQSAANMDIPPTTAIPIKNRSAESIAISLDRPRFRINVQR